MKVNKRGQVLKSFVEVSFQVTKKDFEESKNDPQNAPSFREKKRRQSNGQVDQNHQVGLNSDTCPVALALKRYLSRKFPKYLVRVMPSYAMVLVDGRMFKYDFDFTTTDTIQDIDEDTEVAPFKATMILCDEMNRVT